MAGTRQEAETVDPLSIAYYCTGHGLGHATRSIEVCKHLVERGHTVTVITGAPARVFLQEVCGVVAPRLTCSQTSYLRTTPAGASLNKSLD
jgi:predicted glycosyltransferase